MDAKQKWKGGVAEVLSPSFDSLFALFLACCCLHFFFFSIFGNLRGFLPRYGFGFARMGFLVRGGSIRLDWADLGFDLAGICGVIRLGFRNREDLGSIWYWILGCG